MIDALNLCVDCAHFNDRGYCDRLYPMGHIEPVCGQWVFERGVAGTQRFFPWLCGKKGRHFQPKVNP